MENPRLEHHDSFSSIAFHLTFSTFSNPFPSSNIKPFCSPSRGHKTADCLNSTLLFLHFPILILILQLFLLLLFSFLCFSFLFLFLFLFLYLFLFLFLFFFSFFIFFVFVFFFFLDASTHLYRGFVRSSVRWSVRPSVGR